MILQSPSTSENTSLAFVFFCNNNLSEKKRFIQAAADNGLAQDHVKKCVIFAINIDKEDVPYDMVGVFVK